MKSMQKKTIFIVFFVIVVGNIYADIENNIKHTAQPERNKNPFILSIEPMILLQNDPYNILYSIEVMQLHTQEDIFTNHIDFWIRYGRCSPRVSITDNIRRLHGMYEWSYITDHALYPVYDDVIVNVFYLGYNSNAGIRTNVFDNNNLFILFKYGGGYSAEWFEGKLFDSDNLVRLGVSDGFFLYMGLEFLLESFTYFNKHWYTKLACDVIYSVSGLSQGIVTSLKFGIGMEL